MKSRIVVLAPEPIRAAMAGMGIRALELASALASRHDVRLLAPNEDFAEAVRPGVAIVPAPPGSSGFHRELRSADAALVSGHAASEVFQAAPHLPVAVDWYDPFLVENFHYRETLGEEVEANDRRAWNLALARGDFFLCASEEQRLFYSGMLLQAGRIDAALAAADPEILSLLAVVPFGADAPPAADPGPILRAIGAEPGDPVLFFGGLYDWNDARPLWAVWPEILREFPRSKVVFSENPNREHTPQKEFADAVDVSTRRGWRDRSVWFLPWQPYARRGALYGAAIGALSLCRPGIEAELSFRTRLLDAAAAGLPSVSIHGGGLARRLAAAGAGWAVADAPGLLAALRTLMGDGEARRRASESARAFAPAFAWARVAAPLAAFFDNPRVSARLPFPEAKARPAFRLLRRGRP